MNKALKIEITCSGTEVLPLAELIPFQGGLKTLLDEKRAKLRNSILKHGVSFPFFVWRHAGKVFVLDGHQRDAVLNDLESEGYKVPALPVVYIKAATEKEAREKILLLSSQYGEITEDSLAEYLKAAGIELADILGTVDLPTIDLEAMAQRILQEQRQETEPVPEPPSNPVAVLGDLYELGEHRLMCSDCRKINELERLLGSERPAVLTDPPYGISVVSGNGNGKVGGGGWVDSHTYAEIVGDDTTDTAKAFIQCTRDVGLKDYIIFGGNYFTDFLKPSSCWIVWDKQNTGNFADVELAWTSFDRGARLYPWLWNGLSREGNRAEELTSRVHPTQKPVGLFKKIIEDFPAESYLDGFLGSGTTLIACEQLGRRCFAMEISPAYVDVAIQRYLNLRPGAEVKRNGKVVNWGNLCAARAKD